MLGEAEECCAPHLRSSGGSGTAGGQVRDKWPSSACDLACSLDSALRRARLVEEVGLSSNSGGGRTSLPRLVTG